ncbi:MAG: RNA polymerase sigma factor [Fimbriiglobus sp.]
MSERERDQAIQNWLTQHLAGAEPSPNDLCRLCEGRLRHLVHVSLRGYSRRSLETQTTEVFNDSFIRLLAIIKKKPRSTLADFNRYVAQAIRWVLRDRLRDFQANPIEFVPMPRDLVEPEDRRGALDVDTMAAFHHHVETLTIDDQQMFELLYYRGTSQNNAADILGIPATSLKRHWIRARLHVRARFGFDLDDHLE